MRKKMLFVYNPRSGKGMINQHLPNILNIFTAGGCDVIAHPTQKKGDAEETIKALSGQIDMVVCSGGDGTMDECVTGVMQTSPALPVGYIPAGSTNDFANSLSISKNMVEAAEDIMVGDIYQCDIGSFNENCFVYVAAFGMFTDVSYATDQALKNTLGHLAYILEAGKRMFDIPSYHIMVNADGRRIEGNYAYGMISNSRSIGGFRGIKTVSGDAVDMNDGLFEVTLVHTPQTPMDINEIITSLLSGNTRSSMVESYKARKIVLESSTPIEWTLDGEFGGEHTYVEIENRHKALQLFLNRR
ncbi:MAG: diacylglycerol kinase family protein [Eubacterium sp.]|nr:diacylglycerol kinase family protein [Eubacterium sp.]